MTIYVSWHHYPEVNLISLDIFMCGTANPELALPRIKEFWQPQLVEVKHLRRGQVTVAKLPVHLQDQLSPK
jgi:S-adenosylmethionine decarboxylase